jgi:hypothetical protein
MLHALAYDSARGRTVLFGGRKPGSPPSHADTWEWDGAAWVNVTPAVGPPGRYWPGMAYDSARDRVILFGGSPGLADTWEYDGASWADVTRVPIRRFHHAMAYDSARGRVVLFGGLNGANGLADTWEWDGALWEDVTPVVSPPARYGHALAYDSARGRVVLFGGHTRTPDGTLLADTWEWDGATWENVTPAGSPPARYQHAMAYDIARGRTVLFGGDDRDLGGPLADTWEWDGARWANHVFSPGPGNREGHAMAYDSARARVVLFGGAHGRTRFADTWVWNGIDWADVTPSPSPAGRAHHDLAYDNAHDRVILFGGLDSTIRTIYADTWAWDGDAWVNVTPAMSPRGISAHAMTYDGTRGRVVLLGGLGRNGMWEYGELAETRCDDLDDNGDGQVDEGCDDDGDGWCDAGMPLAGLPAACTRGPGDCEDSEAAVHPGSAEICNGVDDDCDGATDEGFGPGLVTVDPEPARLWPPDHRMVDIRVRVAVSGVCPGACSIPPGVLLLRITSSEPDGAQDIQEAIPSTADFDFRLRAERDEAGAGRSYEATFIVTDCFGDTAVGTGAVLVPHDNGVAGAPLPRGHGSR